MIVCSRCFQEMRSRGEVQNRIFVTPERIKELNIPIIQGYFNYNDEFVESDEHPDDDVVECQFCNEVFYVEEMVEV